MAAAMMSQMTCSAPLAGGLSALTTTSSRKLVNNAVAMPRLAILLAGRVRCEAGKELREAIDESTKKDITEAEILKSMETNESEQRSYFGAKTTAGFDQTVGFTPRPEIERRPETGDKSFLRVFAFNGAAPETINCRLAMLGMVWAFVAEKATGLTVLEQLFNSSTSGLVYYVGSCSRKRPLCRSRTASRRMSQLRPLHGAGGAMERATGDVEILLAGDHGAHPPGSPLPLSESLAKRRRSEFQL